MFEQAERTIEFLGDLSPETFVGALLLALVIAVTTAGTYRWLGACLKFTGYAMLANDRSTQRWEIWAECVLDPIPTP